MKPNTVDSILQRLIIMEPGVLPSGCWEWPGRRCSADYGQVSMSGKLKMVHRVVYEHYRGPIPDGYELDHLCRNRICANPEHLRVVTRRQNTSNPQPYQPKPRQQKQLQRTCPHGIDAVTRCVSCTRDYHRNYRKNHRAALLSAPLPPCCRNGHPLIPENVSIFEASGKVRRICRLCCSQAGKKGGKPSHRPKAPA